MEPVQRSVARGANWPQHGWTLSCAPSAAISVVQQCKSATPKVTAGFQNGSAQIRPAAGREKTKFLQLTLKLERETVDR